MINDLRGFTLLELLVVIAIIGILVALGTVSYSTAQKKSRDSKRQSDLKEIQNALESYHAVEDSKYPTTYPDDIASYFSTGSVPVDPKTGDPYVGNPFGVDGYTICTDLEKDGTGADDGDEDICDFSISNLQ